MKWSPEVVRSRFVEACDTERRLPLGGGTRSCGYWPAYVYSFEDMNGWGTKRLAEEREMRLARIPPSAAAISRFDEVMAWSASLIHDDTRRHIVWCWARCQALDLSFAERCRKFGWVKMTAYRRLHAVSEAISFNLNNDGVLLRMPDEKWVLPSQPVSGSNLHMLALNDETEQPLINPTHWTDGEAIEDRPDLRDFSWAQRQAKREAKRRAKLKMNDAA